jgi:hypothetical protein
MGQILVGIIGIPIGVVMLKYNKQLKDFATSRSNAFVTFFIKIRKLTNHNIPKTKGSNTPRTANTFFMKVCLISKKVSYYIYIT